MGKTRPRIGLNSSVREAFLADCELSSSVTTPHHSNDPQVAVHNGQILKAVLAHDFQSLIHRLIFEAVVVPFSITPWTNFLLSKSSETAGVLSRSRTNLSFVHLATGNRRSPEAWASKANIANGNTFCQLASLLATCFQLKVGFESGVFRLKLNNRGFEPVAFLF